MDRHPRTGRSGRLHATVAGHPYVVSEGDTEQEARENVLEALVECIENDRRAVTTKQN